MIQAEATDTKQWKWENDTSTVFRFGLNPTWHVAIHGGFHGGDYGEWCLLGCYAVWLF
jgi:hypothetical protein